MAIYECEHCGSEWNTTTGRTSCPNPRCPPKLEEHYGERIKVLEEELREYRRRRVEGCERCHGINLNGLVLGKKNLCYMCRDIIEIDSLRSKIKKYEGNVLFSEKQSLEVAKLCDWMLNEGKKDTLKSLRDEVEKMDWHGQADLKLRVLALIKKLERKS